MAMSGRTSAEVRMLRDAATGADAGGPRRVAAGRRVSSLAMKSLLLLGWRGFKTLCTWLLGLLILFEEWGWVPLARLLGAFSRLPFIAWLERRISALPPGLALLVFLVP